MHKFFGVLVILVGLLGFRNYKRLYGKIKSQKISAATKTTHCHFILGNIGVMCGFIFAGPSAIAGRWLFGDFACKLYGLEGFIFGMSSIQLLVALAYDRYCCTTRQRPLLSSSTIAIICWTLGLFWSMLPLFGFGKYSLEATKVSCTVDVFDKSVNYYLFIVGLITLGFLLPVIVSLVFLCGAWSYEMDTSKTVGLVDRALNKAVYKVTIVYVFSWTGYVALTVSSFIGLSDNGIIVGLCFLAQLTAKFGSALIPCFYPNSFDKIND